MKYRIILLAVLVLTGCATQPPEAINGSPISTLTVAEVRAAPADTYTGSRVRWGGIIASVENLSDRTLVEVVSHRLAANARPETQGQSDGRFIASFSGFAEPLTYKTGALLTVVGDIDEPIVRPIGDYEYSFPVVNVTGAYRWAPDDDVRTLPPPWWYYDPWPYYPHYYPYRWPHYPYRRW
jgi:outer membrane lipoprotein